MKKSLSNNPNNISADIYDKVRMPLKNEIVTDAEIALINNLFPPGVKVLDVACGTGRHLIPLAELGYEVTGIDSSEEMIRNQKSKIKNQKYKKEPKIITRDILAYSLRPKAYSLILLFWNAFNEIALTKKDAEKLLRKLKTALAPDGKIIINMNNPKDIKPKAKFSTEYFDRETQLTYELDWEFTKFNKNENISTSTEKITVINSNVTVVKSTQTSIKQRWWSMEEVKDLCKKINLKVENNVNLKINDEYYLLITHS